jgi:general secretion pathway protein K
MKPHRLGGYAKQRGIALITAILMVALATILAVKVGFDAYLDFRRASTIYALDQGFQVAVGAEAWAADVLATDLRNNSKETHFGQSWATPIPAIPIDGGELSGQMEDMQGRFNLNNLLPPADSGDGQQVARQQAYIEQFKFILELAQLEPEWADKIVDWVDPDTVETFPAGAEDNEYGAQAPPYRAANMPITRTSELLALKEFGLARYRVLEPLVTALPHGTKINICTAPGIVLDSFSTVRRQQSFSADAQVLAQQRGKECFPDENTFKTQILNDPKELQHFTDTAGTTSDYFRSTVVVSIGTNQFTLYSLLRRDPKGQVRAQLRSFGTP